METIEVKVRIPKEIHAGVKAEAATEGRTLVKQIVQNLKERQDSNKKGCNK